MTDSERDPTRPEDDFATDLPRSPDVVAEQRLRFLRIALAFLSLYGLALKTLAPLITLALRGEGAVHPGHEEPTFQWLPLFVLFVVLRHASPARIAASRAIATAVLSNHASGFAYLLVEASGHGNFNIFSSVYYGSWSLGAATATLIVLGNPDLRRRPGNTPRRAIAMGLIVAAAFSGVLALPWTYARVVPWSGSAAPPAARPPGAAPVGR